MQNSAAWTVMAGNLSGNLSADQLLQRGRRAFETGQFSEAAGEFSLVLLGQPGHVEALRFRSEAYFRLEKYQESFNDANQVLAAAPKDAVALNRRGMILAMSGHLDEALTDLTQLLQADPDHVEARLRRYWVFMRMRQVHAAEEDMRRLLIVLPDETPIQMTAAECFLQTGHLASARDVLTRVLGREPENVTALKYRGLAWRHLGAPEMSVDDFSAALDVTGDDPALLVERAASLIELGKRTFTQKAYRYAIEDLTKVVEEMDAKLAKPAVVYNIRAQAWTFIAQRAWFDKSGYRKAIDDYDTAILKEPEFLEAYHNRASLHWHLGNVDDVIEDCTKILSLKADHVEALHLRAEAFLRKKEHEKADADFDAIDRIHDSTAEDAEKTRLENRSACDNIGGCGGHCH